MTDAAPDTTDLPAAGKPATEQTLERDTAVNGTPPDEDDDAPAPAEGGDDVPPPTKNSPQG